MPAELKETPLALKIDDLGFIDFDLGIFYNRIPKAASTSVPGAIAENKFSKTFSTDVGDMFPIKPKNLTQKQVEEFSDYYKFTFVRNPYARVLSAYLHKVVKDGKLQKTLASEDASFSAFVSYIKSVRGGIYHNIHWAPQTSLLLISPQEFDAIGKVENIETDLPQILKPIFPKMRQISSKESYNLHATKATTKLADFYTEETQEMVYKLYKDDFDTFGYSQGLPLNL